MIIKVREKQALKNLTHFKHKLLRKIQGLEENILGEATRDYPICIHIKTGDMRFLKAGEKCSEYLQHLKDAEGWHPKDFLPFLLLVSDQRPHFLLRDEKKKEFDQKVFDRTSRKVLRETLRVLSKKAESFTSEGRVEDFVLSNLAEFQFEEKQEDVLATHAFKGSISRIQAEKLLDKKPIGTYLIRNSDEITEGFRVCYDTENCVVCKGYLLTLRSDEDKISEYLLLKNDEWMIYDDDPDYEHQARHYPSFDDLIHDLPDAKKAIE